MEPGGRTGRNQLGMRRGHLLTREGHERFAGQLPERDAALARQRVRFGQRHHQAIVLVQAGGDLCGLARQRRQEQAEIQAAPGELLELVLGRHFDHAQPDLRKLLAEVADQFRHETIAGAADEAERQLAGTAVARGLCARDGYALVVQPVVGLFEKDLAGRRQRHGALVAQEQRHADLRLQFLDRLAARRLRDAHARGGAAVVQLLRHGDELPKQAAVHHEMFFILQSAKLYVGRGYYPRLDFAPHSHGIVMDSSISLAGQAHQAVAALLGTPAAWDEPIAPRLRFHGEPPVFDSPHLLTLSAGAAIGAYALAIERWWHLATGQRQTVAIDWMQAACSLNPGHFQKQSGYVLPALSLLTELKADFYQTADQRWFFPIGSYPHLRDGVLDLLQCPNNAASLGAAIGRWNSHDLEEAFAAHKLPGAYARSREEWLAHPQGRLLASRPVIEIQKIDDSAPEPARAAS